MKVLLLAGGYGTRLSEEFFGTARVFIEKELIAENCQNSKIFNCSSESLLNMFEYKNLGEIIK